VRKDAVRYHIRWVCTGKIQRRNDGWILSGYSSAYCILG